MLAKKPFLVLVLVATFGLSGCDYFRPAQPEIGPGGSVPPVTINYSSPEKTLETIQFAIQDKSATNGQSAYIGGFANPATDGEGFTTTFDPFTLARFQTPPNTDWNVDREQNFYSNLSQVLAGFSFTFDWGHDYPRAPEDVPGATTWTLYRSYRLFAKPADRDTFVNEAYGNAELHFVLVDNKWKIVKWIDVEDSRADFNAGQQSFGFLRLTGPPP